MGSTRWVVDGGPGNRHTVEFDGKVWHGHENILPREDWAWLFAALRNETGHWKHYTVTKINESAG